MRIVNTKYKKININNFNIGLKLKIKYIIKKVEGDNIWYSGTIFLEIPNREIVIGYFEEQGADNIKHLTQIIKENILYKLRDNKIKIGNWI